MQPSVETLKENNLINTLGGSIDQGLEKSVDHSQRQVGDFKRSPPPFENSNHGKPQSLLSSGMQRVEIPVVSSSKLQYFRIRAGAFVLTF
jgi:hypothetical protein